MKHLILHAAMGKKADMLTLEYVPCNEGRPLQYDLEAKKLMGFLSDLPGGTWDELFAQYVEAHYQTIAKSRLDRIYAALNKRQAGRIADNY